MRPKILVPLLLVSLFLASCTSGVKLVQITSTPTSCPYMRNPGPPPPEVEKRAQDALIAMGPMGIRGTLKVEANGEYSCDHFAVEDINFEYTLYVSDLQDQTTIKEYVSKVKDSAKASLQGWNLGAVSVRFVAGQECVWNELQNACAPIQTLTSP
jgi:hypothetical protein